MDLTDAQRLDRSRRAAILKDAVGALVAAKRIPPKIDPAELEAFILQKLARDLRDPGRPIANSSDDDFQAWLSAQFKARGIA